MENISTETLNLYSGVYILEKDVDPFEVIQINDIRDIKKEE